MRGSQGFDALDDEEAVVIAEILKEACSDCVTRFVLWRGDIQVLRDIPAFESMRDIARRRQANIVSLEEAISDSRASIASSRRLLMLTALTHGHFAPAVPDDQRRRETWRQVGPLSLDLINRNATRNERPIDLLPREFKLLDYLMKRADSVVTHEMLFREVWHYKFVPADTNLVRVQVGKLRRKIDRPDDWRMLQIIRRAGIVLMSRPNEGVLPAPGSIGTSVSMTKRRAGVSSPSRRAFQSGIG